MLMHLSMLAGHHLVPSVMQPLARVVRVDQSLQDAACAMGLGIDASVVVVDDSNSPVGVLTARDAARCGGRGVRQRQRRDDLPRRTDESRRDLHVDLGGHPGVP
jgi:hypothetical protein